MRDARIVCRQWDGNDYAHFLGSCVTDIIEGRHEFDAIRSACTDHPIGEGYAYRYAELEDGVEIPDTVRFAYHPSRNDLF